MSSQKVTITPTSSYTSQPATASALTAALIDAGSIPLIQSTLLHELQASGWTANLRSYVTALMRSGECTKYDELMERVIEAAMRDVGGKKEGEGLRIPEQAVRVGVKVVRRELERVCVVDEGK